MASWKVRTKIHQPFNKKGFQSFRGFDALWGWSILSTQKVLQGCVIKLKRNIRISLIYEQVLGANFESKWELTQDFSGDSLILYTKIVAENVWFFLSEEDKWLHMTKTDAFPLSGWLNLSCMFWKLPYFLKKKSFMQKPVFSNRRNTSVHFIQH